MFTFLCYYINQLSYAIIQKYKQKTNSFYRLYNSQNITIINVIYNIFEKNVNKQLKSADFFFKSEDFEKNSLEKVLAIVALISKHTLHLEIHLHLGHNG